MRGEDRKAPPSSLEAIVKEDPTNPQASYWLGSMALDAKKPAEAADWFNKTIVLDPHFEQAYYDLALPSSISTRPPNALATLDKARQTFPQGFVLEFFTGMALSHAKDYTNAIKHYNHRRSDCEGHRPQTTDRDFLFSGRRGAERIGDLAQAQKHFEKCLELSPDFAEALNYLGYMWTEHDENLDKARALIEKAVKLEPKTPPSSTAWAGCFINKNSPGKPSTSCCKQSNFAKNRTLPFTTISATSMPPSSSPRKPAKPGEIRFSGSERASPQKAKP